MKAHRSPLVHTLLLIPLLLGFGVPDIQAQGADGYSLEQYGCRKAWCEPTPKIDCCWEYCAFAACTKSEPWDSAAWACTPQQNAYLTCKANAADASIAGWGGSWKLTSKHTSGKYKGASVTTTLTVSIAGNSADVRFGNSQAKVLSISPSTLVIEYEGGGNLVRTTLNRSGNSAQGTFTGYSMSDRKPIGGEYKGERKR